jgi:alpha-beta hydrolase superfamily lysophospholipase
MRFRAFVSLFTSEDGLRIACRRWDSREPARGVFQIAHGVGGTAEDTVS